MDLVGRTKDGRRRSRTAGIYLNLPEFAAESPSRTADIPHKFSRTSQEVYALSLIYLLIYDSVPYMLGTEAG